MRTEEIGNMTEVPHERLCPAKAFDVGNKFGSLDRVEKLTPLYLPPPTAHCSRSRPGVEGRVQFYGSKALPIMSEPLCRG